MGSEILLNLLSSFWIQASGYIIIIQEKKSRKFFFSAKQENFFIAQLYEQNDCLIKRSWQAHVSYN